MLQAANLVIIILSLDFYVIIWSEVLVPVPFFYFYLVYSYLIYLGKASISLTSTPSAPVRAKRAQSVKSVTRPSPNTTPTAPSLRLDTASKSRRPSDLPATDSVSSARRRPLSAMNITGKKYGPSCNMQRVKYLPEKYH